MSSIKLPILADANSTLKDWSTTLTRWVEGIENKLQTAAPWDLAPQFASANFASVTSTFSSYVIINGHCFFSANLSVITTATPGFNFTISLPVMAPDGVVVIGNGYTDPVFPSGSPRNAQFAVLGALKRLQIERVDKNLWVASTTSTLYINGFYRVS